MSRVKPALAVCLSIPLMVAGCPLVAELVLEKTGESIALPADADAVETLIDIPLDLIAPEMVLDVSDVELWVELLNAAAEAAADDFPFSVYLGLVPGLSDAAQFTFLFDISNPEVVELLAAEDVEPDPEGFYSAVSMLFITDQETCNIYRYDDISPEVIIEHKGAKLKNGCCAILAAAHSLVRKMGRVVTESDATIDKNGDGTPDEWDPEFLKKIRKASGDTDNDRGLSDAQGEAAHTADWNAAWKIQQIDDDELLYDNKNVSCEALKTRCNKLIERLKTNDDISMRIRGKDSKKGEQWGHRNVVQSATFTDGPPCCCTITVIETSVTEKSGKTDFVGITYKPGLATYTICTDSNGKTTVRNTEFPTSIITWLAFDSFDEEPKSSDVKSTDQGARGSALED